MKRTGFLAILSVLILGFIWGIIVEQKVFYAIGSALGLVVFSLLTTLIIFLITLLLQKFYISKAPKNNKNQPNRAKLFFRIYTWNGLIIGSFLILQHIFDLLPKFIH